LRQASTPGFQLLCAKLHPLQEYVTRYELVRRYEELIVDVVRPPADHQMIPSRSRD
jgi:hypothetical protein